MRGCRGFSAQAVTRVFRRLLGLRHIAIEDRDMVGQALSNCDAGIDLADALHHASDRSCASVATFDDRKFARRSKKLGMAPAVTVLA